MMTLRQIEVIRAVMISGTITGAANLMAAVICRDADALYTAFAGWVADQGITLYPAQDEAILELVTGNNVVLATPTGSGKSTAARSQWESFLGKGRRSASVISLGTPVRPGNGRRPGR